MGHGLDQLKNAKEFEMLVVLSISGTSCGCVYRAHGYLGAHLVLTSYSSSSGEEAC